MEDILVPVLIVGMLFVGLGNSHIVALKQEDGTQVWEGVIGDGEVGDKEVKRGQFIAGGPTYANGVVMSGLANGDYGIFGRVVGLDAKTGTFNVDPLGTADERALATHALGTLALLGEGLGDKAHSADTRRALDWLRVRLGDTELAGDGSGTDHAFAGLSQVTSGLVSLALALLLLYLERQFHGILRLKLGRKPFLGCKPFSLGLSLALISSKCALNCVLRASRSAAVPLCPAASGDSITTPTG